MSLLILLKWSKWLLNFQIPNHTIKTSPNKSIINEPLKTASTQNKSIESSSSVLAAPSIRKLARELGVSLAKIKGTGQKGRILNEDLKSYGKQIVSHGGFDDDGFHSSKSFKSLFF